MPFDFVKCSKNLYALRKRNKESHQTLADCFGKKANGESAISKQTLINYEKAAKNGGASFGAKSDKTESIRGMNIETLVKLADHFDVSTDYILGRTDYESSNPDVVSASKTTGLDENAIRRLALEAVTGEKSPMLQAVDLLLTTRSGKEFLQDLYRYAIAKYDKFTITTSEGTTVDVDRVCLSSDGKAIDELIIEKMGNSFMSQMQDDLFRLKDEYDDKKEEKRNGEKGK